MFTKDLLSSNIVTSVSSRLSSWASPSTAATTPSSLPRSPAPGSSNDDLLSLCLKLDFDFLDVEALPLDVVDRCRSSALSIINRSDIQTSIESLHQAEVPCITPSTNPTTSPSSPSSPSSDHQTSLNPIELQLASHLIRNHPHLNQIRFQLVPKRLDEITFWRILFGLLESSIAAELSSSPQSSTARQINDDTLTGQPAGGSADAVDELLDQLQSVLDDREIQGAK